MLKQIAIVLVVLSFIPLALKLLAKLRLLPLAIYAFLAGVIFVHWAEAHRALSIGILIALAALTVLSWLVTLYRHIAENRRIERNLLLYLQSVKPLYEVVDGRYVRTNENE